jgi:N-acetylated-alpha-linked acidic dipeptidase
LDLGYGGENEGGEYHTMYDTYDHYKRFKDPKFEYGIMLAKTAGHLTLRLVDAEILPFDFYGFYKTVNAYAQEVATLLETMRETTAIENQLISEKRYEFANDPTKKLYSPSKKVEVPYLNFAPLQNAVEQLENVSADFSAKQKANVKPVDRIQLNQLLFQAEQKLLSEAGLPRRPWYKHTIYAPGFYTGYGVKTLPGIREAIEQRNWTEAQQQIEVVANRLSEYSSQITKAISLLK